MKLAISIIAIAVATSSAAFAGGHTQGRVAAFENAVAASPAVEKQGLFTMATRIIGDKGQGNGNEPYAGLSDHDPNILGGNGGDPDVAE